MSSKPMDRAGDASAPSMLDLVRMSRRHLFPPGGVELYRQIALLTDLADGTEVLDAACGPGVCLEYFVAEYGVHGSGVDYDPNIVEVAEDRTREAGLTERLQFQHAPLDALPYRDEIFDVAVGELGLAAAADPEAAVRELVRVTKPGGRVVLVQLVWKAPVEEARRRVLSDHLGARPLMLVEWKRLLREAGVGNLHTEDWSDEETAFRPQIKKPFPDFSELFSWSEKIGILRRAWGRWGFQGVRTALAREMEVHRVLTRERILGLDLVIGRKRQGDSPVVVEVAGPTAEAPDEEVGAPADQPAPALAERRPMSHDAPPADESAEAEEPTSVEQPSRPGTELEEPPGPTSDGSESDPGKAADVEDLPLFKPRDDS
jgi:SAM-dependent methyltransferase